MTQPANGNNEPLPNRQPPLTDAELVELRELLESDRRAKWLWSTLRTWSLWLGGVIGAITLTWDSLARVVKSMAGN